MGAAALSLLAAGAFAEAARSAARETDSRSGTAAPHDPASEVFAGQTLGEALYALQQQGLTLVFTDQVVLPEMKVLADPRANEIAAFGVLGDVADVIYSAGINGPALLIIGEVVALAQRNQTAPAEGKGSAPKLSSLWEMLS